MISVTDTDGKEAGRYPRTKPAAGALEWRKPGGLPLPQARVSFERCSPYEVRLTEVELSILGGELSLTAMV